MLKFNESTTEHAGDDGDGFSDAGSIKKPGWVDLAPLDGIADDPLLNRLVYKPALRFHGLSGSLWDPTLGRSPSIATDSRPPSYRFSETHRGKFDPDSFSDQGSLYNARNAALSPLTLRRRNTIGVILVAIGLLAAVAAVTGTILHFINPRAMVRANVRFTIANRNYTDQMSNESSHHFKEIAEPICEELDNYFLTSELSDFYFGCTFKEIGEDPRKPGSAVYLTLDFVENMLTNDGDRIKRIIMKKSGRHKTEDTLYLVVKDFLVYLRSLRIDLDVVPMSGKHPRRTRPRIPWNDMDFIFRLTKSKNFTDIAEMTDVMRQLVSSLADMTMKLDKMQMAIYFVNATLHETKEPLFRLDETLQNMTISLRNLNDNLRDFNHTLLAIKDFLKQFDSSVFNLDDVLKNLDSTVLHLGNSVRFVGNSMIDLNSTVANTIGNIVNISDTLSLINRSVTDVNNTATFTNKTLESMADTLESLELAIENLNRKLGFFANEFDMFNFSLHGINNTVHNSYNKLSNLQRRFTKLNSTVGKIDATVNRLQNTYAQLNKSLGSMNETFASVNGTVLEVIQKLSDIDTNLAAVVLTMYTMRDNMTEMNDSISDTMVWMKGMLDTLHNFNLSHHFQNDSIRLALNNVDLIETVGLLLDLNGTLVGLGRNVDGINLKLDTMDDKMTSLEETLGHFENTLSTIGTTFDLLNRSLGVMNHTISDTRDSLGAMDDTVEQIETSFEEINPSFDFIDKSLEFINKTFQSVRLDKHFVDTTIREVNKTLSKMNETAISLDGSGITLNRTINDIQGTLSEIAVQIYNSNESLRILKGKTNIFEESYNMMHRAMSNIESIHDDMTKRLSEAEISLDKSNNSLYSVNSSLAKMTESYTKMDFQLQRLEDSFKNMDDSMHGIGSAFPTLTGSIKSTRDKLNALKNRVATLNEKLNLNDVKRDTSSERYNILKEEFSDLKQQLNQLRLEVDGIQTLSKSVSGDVEKLNKNVNSIGLNYDKIVKNFDLMNKTLPNMNDRFNSLQQSTKKINNDIQTTTLNVRKIEEDIINEIEMFKDYDNVNISFDDIQEDLLKQLISLNTTSEGIIKEKDAFEKSKSVIWDDDFRPHLLQNATTDVNRSIIMVSQGFDKYEDVLSNSLMTINSSNLFTNTMQYLIQKMKVTKKSLDTIEHKNTAIEESAETLKNDILNKTESVEKMMETLKERLDKLQLLKDTYGNVNGTFKEIELYDSIESFIEQTKETILNLKSQLGKMNGNFTNVFSKYSIAHTLYSEAKIDLSENASKLLNDTTDILTETNYDLTEISTSLAKIDETASNLATQLENITNLVEDLRSSLINETDKYNFVSSTRPALEKGFDDAQNPIQLAKIAFKDLQSKVEKLLHIGRKINNESDSISNLDVTTHEEVKFLYMTQENLTVLQHVADVLFENFTKKQEELNIFNEFGLPLSVIKGAYEELQVSLNNIKKATDKIISVKMAIEDNLSQINTTFRDLKIMLTAVHETNSSFTESGGRLNTIETDITETESKIDNATFHLSRVKQEMNIISKNYTNFTATDIDIDELYIHEALLEMDEVLSNLTHSLGAENAITEISRKLYGETDQVLNFNELNRQNTDEKINGVVKPNIHQINNQTKRTQDIIEDINEKLMKIEMRITKVNETLHITNKQLFIDKQKELLADAKIPNIDKDVIKLNETLQITETLIGKARNTLTKVKTAYDKLSDRLIETPTSNMSLDEIGEKLSYYEEYINDFEKDVFESEVRLKDINATIRMTDGSRYSPSESLVDVRDRYKHAEEEIGKLQSKLLNIVDKVIITENKTLDINNDLLRIEQHLNGLLDIQNKQDTFGKSLSTLQKEMDSTDFDLSSILTKLNKENNDFKTIRDRFQHINQSLLHRTMDAYFEDLNKANENLTLLLHSMEYAKGVLSQTWPIFNDSKEIAQKAFDSDNILSDIVTNATLSYETAVENEKNVENELTEIQTNRRIVSAGVDDIDKKLDNILKMFEHQEKIEFVESSQVRDSFVKLQKKFNESMDAIAHLRIDHSLLTNSLDNLKESINKTDDVHISTHALEDNIKVISQNVDQIAEHIERDYMKYKELEKLLFAPDGKVISETENISDMKQRYEQLGKHIDNMTKSLELFNHQMAKDIDRKLQNSEEDIYDKQYLIDNYIANTAFLERLQTELAQLSEPVLSTTNDVQFIYDRQKNNDKTFTRLIEKYHGISNDLIANVTSDIKAAMESNEEELLSVNNMSKNVTDSYDKSMELVKGYLAMKGQNISSTEKLVENINFFKQLVESLPVLLNRSRELVKPSQIKIQRINATLDNVDEQIQLLEDLLRAKEKRDYYESHFPGEYYNATKMLLNDVNLLNHNSKSNADNVILTADELDERVLRHDNIKINVSAQRKIINDIANNIKDNKETLHDLTMQHEHLSQFLLAEDGNFISKNETIESMKKRYGLLNSSLQNVTERLDHIKDNLSNKMPIILDNLVNDMDRTDMALDHFENIISTLNRQETMKNEPEIGLKQLTKNMQLYNQSLENAKNSLKDLIQRFNGVSNDKIKNRTSAINDLYNDIRNQLKSQESNLTSSQSILTNVTSALGELRVAVYSNISDIETLENIITLNQSVSDIVENNINKISSHNVIASKNDVLLNISLPVLFDYIERLKEDFELEEKKTFLSNSTPIIKDHMDFVKRRLNESDRQLNIYKQQHNDVISLGDAVQQVLKSEKSILFTMDDQIRQVDETGERLTIYEKLGKQLLDETESIDTDIITNHTKYIQPNFTIGHLKSIVSSINKTVNRISERTRQQKEALERENKTIQELRTEFNEIQKEMDNFKTARANGIEGIDEIFPMEDVKSNLSDKFPELKTKLDSVLSFLGKIKTKFSDINDATLMSEIGQLSDKINKTFSSFQSTDKDYNTFADILDFLQEQRVSLQDALSRNSSDKFSLQTRIQNISQINERIKPYINPAKEQTQILKTNETEIRNKVSQIELELTNLEQKLLQQQIKDYIENNFPLILDTYRKVNQSIISTEADVNLTSEKVKNLYFNLAKTQALLDNHDTLAIPINTLRNQYETQVQTLQNTTSRNDLSKNKFHDLELKMLASAESNATIDEIKLEFSGLNNSLIELLTETVASENSITTIQNSTSTTQALIKLLTDALSDFEDVFEKIKISNQNLSDIEHLFTEIEDNLSVIHRNVSNLVLMGNNLQKRFENVNSTVLHEQSHLLNEKIERLVNQLNNISTYLNKTDEAFEDNKVVINYRDKLMKTTIESQVQLENVTNEADRLSAIIDNTNADVKLKLGDIKQLLVSLNTNMENTTDKFTNIQEAFKEREIDEFIENAVPTLALRRSDIGSAFKDIIEKIVQAKTKLNNATKSLYAVESDMGRFPQIEFTLEDIKAEMGLTDMKLTVLHKSVLEQNTEFDMLEKLIKEIDRNTSINELRRISAELESRLIGHEENLALFYTSINNILDEIQTKKNQTNFVMNLLSNYETLTYNLSSLITSLDQLQAATLQSNMTLENASVEHKRQMGRLSELNTTFTDSSNDTITAMRQKIDEAEKQHATEISDLSLQFRNKVHNAMSDALNAQEQLSKTLFDKFTSLEEFEKRLLTGQNLLDLVKESLPPVKSENVIVLTEGQKLLDALNATRSKIEQLERLLLQQEKRNIIESNLPFLLERYLDLNNRFHDAFNDQESIRPNISYLRDTTNKIGVRIDGINNIIIDVNQQETATNRMEDKITHIRGELLDRNKSNNALNIFSISPEELIHNDSVQIAEVESLIERLNRTITDNEIGVIEVEQNIIKVSDNISIVAAHLRLLNMSLNEFERLKNNVDELRNSISRTHKNATELNETILNLNNKMVSLTNRLALLEKLYQTYNYDSADEKGVIETAKIELKSLQQSLDSVISKVTDIGVKQKDMNLKIQQEVSDLLNLRTTIANVSAQHNSTLTDVENADAVLQSIWNALPNVNVIIADIENNIDTMNKTLINEYNKDKLSNDTIPALERRYEGARVTFDMTNKSLDVLADNIKVLKDYIAQLKHRMDKDFTNINISMIENEDEIGRLEDRLTNMIYHYNNVKEIVSSLDKELDSHRVKGENITVKDVEAQYNEFNKTLNVIEDVLFKIQQDSYEMEEHFYKINSTLVDIDTALDIFEERGQKTKEMASDISVVGSTLEESDSLVATLDSKLVQLNETFVNMMDFYKDVVESTKDNNTLAADKIGTLKDKLKAIHSSVMELQGKQSDTKSNFDHMNNTLFKQIETYTDLNNTLDTVLKSYNGIEDNLRSIKYELNVVENMKNSANSSIDQLTSFLNNLNDTLHKEKEKFDFVNSNSRGLDSKLRSIVGPLQDTEQTLSNMADVVNNTKHEVSEVAAKLYQFPNIAITVDGNQDEMTDMQTKLENMKSFHGVLKSKAKEIANELLHFGLGSGEIEKLRENYMLLNETIEELQNNITSVSSTLKSINSTTAETRKTVADLTKTLKTYEELTNQSGIASSGMEKVKTSLNDTEGVLNSVVDSVNEIETNIHNMHEYYSDIQNVPLKNNLTSILQELQRQKERLSSLKMLKVNITRDYIKSEQVLQKGNTKFQGPISNITELNTVIGNATHILNITSSAINEVSLKNAEIFEETESVIANIDKLENELKSVNESLFEEKLKNDFIRENYPDMETRFLLLNDDLSDSNIKVDTANENAKTVAANLASLKNDIDSFHAIQVSLDNDNASLVTIKSNIRHIVDAYNNVSRAYLSLKLEDLKQTENTSLNQLKTGFDKFESVLNEIKENITAINAALTVVKSSSGKVNASIVDFNETLAMYKNANEILQNQLDTQLLSNMTTAQLKASITQTQNDFDNINEKFEALLNFSHIMDPEILQAKASIETLMGRVLDKVKQVHGEVGGISEKGEKNRANINEIQRHLNSTKTYLQELKEHVSAANTTAGNVTRQFDLIQMGQQETNRTMHQLQPELKDLIEKVNNLSRAYQREQKKIDFMADNKPIITQAFEQLDEPLKKANNHISKSERNLADLLFNIKETDSRLEKFRTLNIVANSEMSKWTTMSNDIKGLSMDFIEASKLYNQIKGEIPLLDNKNMNQDELERRYEHMNSSIRNISSVIRSVVEKLQRIDADVFETSKSVQDLNSVMNVFKELQIESKNTRQTLSEGQSKLSSLQHTANETSALASNLPRVIKEMEATYQPIHDENWGKILPTAKSNVSDIHSTLASTEEKLNTAMTGLDNIQSDFVKVEDGIQNKILLRETASDQIKAWQNELNSAKSGIKTSDQKIKELEANVPKINQKAYATEALLKTTNSSLFLELQKQLLVNQTLPDLKQKHQSVNETFVMNYPDVDTLTAQLNNVAGIIDKIKKKMAHFGLTDADSSLGAWSQSIQRLNDTVTAIIQKNIISGQKLQVLREKLWSDMPLYTKEEALLEVKRRLEEYNKTLDEIRANSHEIKIKLGDLGNTVQKMTGEVTERDVMLTTTPATTTPSGPPDWLSFTSTGGGVIGRHSAHAQCSVSNLEDWSAMTIKHMNNEGTETPVAMWKLGRGARGRRQNRRIKVYKQETGQGGTLHLNITSLQCADEGTYYCAIDTFSMWPLNTEIKVSSPPEDNLHAEFPTEVFAEKITNFSCIGNPGYPSGKIIWKVKEPKEKDFKLFDFYSAKSVVSDRDCIRSETNTVTFQFNMTWNNTQIRCYIENTDFFAQGVIRILPFDICNKHSLNQAMSHPYTPHKYIICGQELNIMNCPGNTCFDDKEGLCGPCKAGSSDDPCIGKPMYTAVAHEHDCKKYYMCMGNTKKTNKCPKGYFAPNVPGNCVLAYAQSFCEQKEAG